MDPVRRKFKPDISSDSIDRLIEKRQRKRNFLVNKKPYSRDGETMLATQGGNKPMARKVGDITVIQEIPREMFTKSQQLQTQLEHKQREFEKPEHWVMPKRGPKVSSGDNLKHEADIILKSIDRRATYSRAARAFLKARNQSRKPLGLSEGKMTAKGYLSRRIDND